MATPRAAVTVPEDRNVTAFLISSVEKDHYTLQGVFQERGWILHTADSLESAATLLREKVPSVVITEKDLLVGTWKDVLEFIHRLPDPPLVVVTSEYADAYLWAEALNLGVYDVLAKPFNKTEVIRVFDSASIRHKERPATPSVVSAG